MSIWNFPPVTFPAGTLKTTVYNSDGQSTVFNESGDWLLNISPLVESVERSGAGCELRTDEITLEMYDRGNLFRQHIFTSQAYCLLLLNVGGTD
ncbi:MAG TPA: hypothetical protein VKS81_07640, partial [Bacteroidota bacterium]|nr:hypothetical protein [Bacteroidota bacterium]